MWRWRHEEVCKVFPEAHERAVRMVLVQRGEHPSVWTAIESIASRTGHVRQALQKSVRRYQVETGMRGGVSSAERDRVKAPERVVKVLRQANKILKLASAFFAQAELESRPDVARASTVGQGLRRLQRSRSDRRRLSTRPVHRDAASAQSLQGMISTYPPSSNLGRICSGRAARTAPDRLGFLRVVTIVAVSLLYGCAQMPSLDGRSASMILQDTSDTRLGKAALPMVQAHPGKSGVFALSDGRDAFAARVLLADASERSLDIQYYIWNGDKTGTLMFEALRRAADRGVRVRLLLDDNGTAGLDTVLAALDTHPNIEVRLFNPFLHRRWRALSFLTDFWRLNRRMHNKSFTADNQATIIGGRNVGDEYFDAGQGVSFVDLDVLAIGPVVNDVSADFDRYWASESSYPAERVLARVSQTAIAEVTAAAARVEKDPAAVAYMQAIARSQYVQQVLARQLPFEWATVHMVSDDPAKGLGRASDDELLWTRLKQVLQAPKLELELVSPYFVPGKEGVEYFSALARQGIKVTILTNSLAATDVTAVHAGYAKRRKPMLEAGVEIFEMEPEFSPAPTKAHGPLGSSSASLHAKTFSIDRKRAFVGSFNFDPRSQRLNTELGFVIDSPAMAEAIADAFATIIPARAYKVRLSDAGALQWVEQRNGQENVYDREPRTGFWLRVYVAVLSVLPIEWLL